MVLIKIKQKANLIDSGNVMCEEKLQDKTSLNNAGLFERKFGFKHQKFGFQLQFSTAHFFIAFLTQHLGLSIFDPNLG